MSREHARLDASTTCCRPSREGTPSTVRVPRAELDEELRAQIVDEEAQRRERWSVERRESVSLLVDSWSLSDLLNDVQQTLEQRWSRTPGEQTKQRGTIVMKLAALVDLAERYGL